MPVRVVLIIIGLALSAGCQGKGPAASKGDDPATRASGPASDLSPADEAFVLAAASFGAFEMRSSQLALSKATDADERQFAQQMIQEFVAINAQLASIATAKRLDVPEALSPPHQAALDALATTPRGALDADFHAAQDKLHDDAIAVFATAAKDASDADVKAFAQNNLSSLKRHKAMLADHDH